MIVIVSAPLFRGRPEIEITRAIREYAEQNNIEHSFISMGILPLGDAGAVYDDDVMAEYYTRTTDAVVKQIRNKDIVFWVDLWNPGIDMLFHYCAAKHIQVSNFGIFHSAPTIKGDYLQNSEWAKNYQKHLFKHIDGCFVATEYLKNCFDAEEYSDKIHVTGLPTHLDTRSSKTRKYQIVFNHRWAEDKRPSFFMKLAEWWESNINDGLEFAVFTPNDHVDDASYELLYEYSPVQLYCNKTKEEYYERLSKARYVFANSELETFGYAVYEGYKSGCIPILNDMPCYRELYPNNIYTYNEDDDIASFKRIEVLIKHMTYSNTICNVKPGAVERMYNKIEQVCKTPTRQTA